MPRDMTHEEFVESFSKNMSKAFVSSFEGFLEKGPDAEDSLRSAYDFFAKKPEGVDITVRINSFGLKGLKEILPFVRDDFFDYAVDAQHKLQNANFCFERKIWGESQYLETTELIQQSISLFEQAYYDEGSDKSYQALTSLRIRPSIVAKLLEKNLRDVSKPESAPLETYELDLSRAQFDSLITCVDLAIAGLRIKQSLTGDEEESVVNPLFGVQLLSQNDMLQKAKVIVEQDLYDQLDSYFNPDLRVELTNDHLSNMIKLLQCEFESGSKVFARCELPLEVVDEISHDYLRYGVDAPKWAIIKANYKGKNIKVVIDETSSDHNTDVHTKFDYGEDTDENILAEFTNRLREYLDSQFGRITKLDDEGSIMNVGALPNDTGNYINKIMRVVHLMYEPEKEPESLLFEVVKDPKELGFEDKVYVLIPDASIELFTSQNISREGLKEMISRYDKRNYKSNKADKLYREESKKFNEQLAAENLGLDKRELSKVYQKIKLDAVYDTFFRR